MNRRIMRNYIFFLFLSAGAVLFAQNSIYTQLLEYRYKNDSEFSVIENNAQIAKNTYTSLRISSLFITELSTGQINFTLTGNKERSSFSMEPSVLLGMPLYNNLSLKLKSPYSSTNGGSDFRKGVNLGISADIYSQTRNKLKLQIADAYENMRLAEKKLALSKKLIEKKLLTELQKLFGEYEGLLAKRLEAVRANINYRQTLAQGFGENSAKLRTARLSSLSAEREEKEADFSFSVSSKLFFQSCGIPYDEKKSEDIFAELALSIPKTQIVSIENLREENYSVILKAERDYKNALLQNKINLNLVTLTGEVNFSASKIQNEVFDSGTGISVKNTREEKFIGGGMHMLLPGVQLYSGITFPLENKINASASQNDLSPALQFMLAVNPISIYDYALKRKNANFSEVNEKIKLNEIKRNFENEFKTFKIQKEKFEWQQNICNEEIDVYKKNAEDHAEWFNRGVISSFENMQADIEYKRALARYADANINVSIFNVQVEELFETGGK